MLSNGVLAMWSSTELSLWVDMFSLIGIWTRLTKTVATKLLGNVYLILL
jgi:hypothetical protein